MLDPAQLTAFVTVIRAGSFTKAAETLGTDKAQVSRLVSRLEERLGAQLLIRSTRSLSVTEIGRDVFERALGVIAALEETEAAAAATRDAPSGLLRLTCGEEFGQFVVSHWVSAYLRTYPAVRVEAQFTNRVIDVIHEGFDLAVRVGPLPDSSLVARKLGDIQYAVYASPSLVAARGLPAEPGALAEWPLVLFSGGGATHLTLMKAGEKVSLTSAPRIAVNNNAGARRMIAEGFGAGLLPCFQAEPLVKRGELTELLPGWTRPPVPVHAVYASSRYLSPKVRAFVDLARQSFAQSLRGELDG